MSATGVAIAPTNTESFVLGAWSGTISLPREATNMCLHAEDGTGCTGDSNPIDVIDGGGMLIILR